MFEIIIIWIGLGITGTLYWPLRYYKRITKNDWKNIFIWSPITIASGPFSFILACPL